MSFLEKARQRAEQATQQARVTAAEQARAAQAAIARGAATVQDPATAERARATLRRARRGMATAIDRIDPSILADIVIKATALQERTNAALREKGSLYRIGEVSIGAGIPPTIDFVIQRLGDHGDALSGNERSSTALSLESAAPAGTIQALDGSVIDENELLDDPIRDEAVDETVDDVTP